MTWSLKKSIKRRQTTHRCPGHRGVIFCWCPVYFDSWCPGYRWVPTPYVPDTGEFWLPMSRIPRSFDFRCPGYRGVLIPGVPDTGRVSNIATAFKAIIIVNLSFTIQIHLDSQKILSLLKGYFTIYIKNAGVPLYYDMGLFKQYWNLKKIFQMIFSNTSP